MYYRLQVCSIHRYGEAVVIALNKYNMYILGVHMVQNSASCKPYDACMHVFQVYYKNWGHLEQQLSRHIRAYKIMLSAQHAMNSITL